MRIALYVLAGLALLIAALAGAGALLPVAHVATASATIAQPPDAVYTRIADVAGYPTWWPDDPGVRTEVVEAIRPTRFVSRVIDPEGNFGGTWTIELAPAGAGTRVTITERGEVYNPIFRVLSRFVFGHTATIESFLAALGPH